MDDHAAACWEAVDAAFGPTSIIIQGNSAGSLVALHMSHQQPERVAALILSGCGYLPQREPMRRWIERYEREGLALRRTQVLDHFSEAARSRPLIQHYADMIVELDGPATLSGIIALNRAMLSAESDAFLAEVRTPTLIISGTADRNHRSAFTLREKLGNAELREIEGAGHAVMLEAPWDYDQLVLEFLERLGLLARG